MMMADDVTITPGTGATIATDDVGGRQFQRVKATFGADGTATDVSSANPLPVVQTGALPAGTNKVGNVGLDGYVPPTAIASGQVSLPTANTAARATATSTPIRGVLIKNPITGNSSPIYWGASGVSTSTGFELAAGESVFVDIDNLNKVWCVAGVDSKAFHYVTFA